MIRVWSAKTPSGVLDRSGKYGSTFVYDAQAPAEASVSVTMPVRLESWNTESGLAPIFDMNLPEGALRERLSRRFAKATGTFDDLDVLGVVGRTQIGRVRYTGMNEGLTDAVPFQSIDEILRARRGGDIFDHLIDEFATYSGISGVQPKVLIRGSDDRLSPQSERLSLSVTSATHIVKLWNEHEYPELAANEFFCLGVAQRLGLRVPHHQLSDEGDALIVERFDRDGNEYLGFEDFCVLNGVQSRAKYKGGYEPRLWNRLRDFVGPTDYPQAARDLFTLFAMNCALRNGDAHLKNFGVVYTNIDGPIRLAPVYDVVTTTAYLPNDKLALTLDGSTVWPDRKRLMRLGQIRAGLSARDIETIFAAIKDAIADTSPSRRAYFTDRNRQIGDRIEIAWSTGVSQSL